MPVLQVCDGLCLNDLEKWILMDFGYLFEKHEQTIISLQNESRKILHLLQNDLGKT